MSSDYKHTEILRETRIKGIKNAVLSVWRESGELILNKLIRPERAASSQPGAEHRGAPGRYKEYVESP